jgi:hypothetical protein
MKLKDVREKNEKENHVVGEFPAATGDLYVIIWLGTAESPDHYALHRYIPKPDKEDWFHETVVECDPLYHCVVSLDGKMNNRNLGPPFERKK